MLDKKGFTLTEVLVVLVILGMLTAIAIPTYNSMITQGAVTAAQNNLTTIYNAEKTFYLNNGYYCSTSSQNGNCANNLNNLNGNLILNITDTNFSYSCTDPNAGSDGNNGSSFSCTATNVSNNNLVLTLTNNPIVLPGGTGTRNPSCSSTNSPGYCP